jgi:hypothetical protein
MSPEAAQHLQEIEAALKAHREPEIFAAVAKLIDDNPSDAAFLLWTRFSDEENIYFRRVLSYALAKSAADQPPYLWGPISTFVTSPYNGDDATLVNVLSALQIYDEADDILSAVLAPEFGAFAIHCIAASKLVVEAFCELVVHLSDRGALAGLLSRSQVRILKQQLNAVSTQSLRTVKQETLSILRESSFLETLPDATPRLDQEEESLVRDSQIDVSLAGQLRSVLAEARSRYALKKQAEEVDGVVQEVRLTGQDSSKGRLAVDVFEKLVHLWKTAIRDIGHPPSANASFDMRTYILASAPGSFIMRFLVESSHSEALSQSLDDIANVVQRPEDLSSRTELTPEVRNNLFQLVETLADNNLDATVGVIDPRLFERPRKQIVSREILPAIKQIRERKQERSVPHHFSGTLEGASHRQGSFEAFSETLGHIKGDVPSNRRTLLLNKVIGRPYNFSVEERVTTTGTDEEKRQWVLESLSAIDEEERRADTKKPEDLGKLSSAHVPQQDRLDRVVAVVRVLAGGKDLGPNALEMPDTASSERHIDYMRQAAKILGLIADDGSLTEAGWRLAQLPETRILDFISVQFEGSSVVQLWRKWSGVEDLFGLDENSAVEFLLQSGLSSSMAERRGRTLRKWLEEFKSLRSKKAN